MSSSDRREGDRGNYDRGGDEDRGNQERRAYRPVTCFNCDEQGHYLNQCPHRDHRPYRPSTSTDSRRSCSPRTFKTRRRSPPHGESELRAKVAELSVGVASIKEHFDEVRAKKEVKARKKWEKEQLKEEARRREEEEEAQRAEQLAKQAANKKKEEKAKKEALLRAEMKKDVTLHVALMMSEIKDDWLHQWKTSVLPAIAGSVKDIKGKKKVEFVSEEDDESGYNTEESETSVTQELSEKTERLCLSEKRKREEDVRMEDSPPMEQPAKQTPRRQALKPSAANPRVTRSRSKAKGLRSVIPAKARTPVKTPLSKLSKTKKGSPSGRLTPASKVLARLKFRDAIIKEIKECNANELQRMCREEGLHYEGKLDAIFDLAEHRAKQHFGREGDIEGEVVRLTDLGEAEAEVSEETEG
ncbi:hypothetical protein CBR_g23194 [Chara braunii]|uniref:CCHC-type domain-containing protein n=1 Tax=Chara braunii TaxID=69332 RepID=A0A388JV55_CHABU|nr:hypothetical protein CBR_g23194 [Chara braunii]|eukprot:GBG61678.1 hypothetical protein CBR_g23194 [Chara braunii]